MASPRPGTWGVLAASLAVLAFPATLAVLAAAARGAPYTASVAPRRLRTRALVTLQDSRSESLDRALRACR